MAPDEARAIYRAIDDLGKLMAAELGAIREQLRELRDQRGEIENLKTQSIASAATLQHHEHRLKEIEGNEALHEDHDRDDRKHREQIAAMIVAAAIGALVAFALLHL